VRVLLDTQALLWFLLDDPRLSEPARAIIAHGDTEVVVSPASYWEIAIKISLGKYELDEPLADFFERELQNNRFAILPILPRHAAQAASLPFHHRDPFDRLIIAQALVEALPVLSSDAQWDAYPVQRLWLSGTTA
jgi:PIN domain nuclease of toxin-antitoxin system